MNIVQKGVPNLLNVYQICTLKHHLCHASDNMGIVPKGVPNLSNLQSNFSPKTPFDMDSDMSYQQTLTNVNHPAKESG